MISTSCTRRGEEWGRGWQERFVNAERAAATTDMAAAVAESWSYVVLSGFATGEECTILIQSAMELQGIFLRDGDGDSDTFRGIEVKWVTECSRFSVTKLLNDEAKHMSNVLLRRLLDRLEFGLDGTLDPTLSDLARQLFGTADRLQSADDFDVHWYNEMSHDRASNPEPMVNVYQEGGFFKRHTDMMQLTILVVLKDATDGGGTAFYAAAEPEEENEGDGNESHSVECVPERIERPSIGTALIWSGKLLHSALPVSKGIRVVYVGSFDLVPKT
jgi:2OG-Fe(II) oxygenase superfamily